jgi:uncharacterized protein YbjT (DUF2867 family)
MGKILVTGATGNIGYYVLKDLADRGETVKAAVSDLNRGKKKLEGINCEVVQFDFLNPETFDVSLRDVDRIFLMRPPQLAKPKKDMKPFLDAVKAKGIKHIVFVSLLGVEKNPVVPHRKIEDMIREMKIPYTFLRPSFFMQNLNTTHQEDIKLRNELYMPVGKAKTSFIDTRDIGSISAICLTEEGHLNKSYTLTGSEAIDYYEVGTILSDVLKRKIEYKNPPTLKFRKTLIERGVQKGFANVMMMLYLMTKLGTAKSVTPETERLLKRRPISFRQYAEDHKSYWI